MFSLLWPSWYRYTLWLSWHRPSYCTVLWQQLTLRKRERVKRACIRRSTSVMGAILSWDWGSDSATNTDSADGTSLELLSTFCTADKVTTWQEHGVDLRIHAHFTRPLFLQLLVLLQHVCSRNRTYTNINSHDYNYSSAISTSLQQLHNVSIDYQFSNRHFITA